MLVVVAFEPLATSLQASQYYQTVVLLEEGYSMTMNKVLLYAQDFKTLQVYSSDTIYGYRNTLNRFGRISGYKLNSLALADLSPRGVDLARLKCDEILK